MTWKILTAVREHLFTDLGALLVIPAGCLAVLLDAYFTTEVGDSQASICCRYPPASGLLSQEHVRQLEDQGFVVLVCPCPSLLPALLLRFRLLLACFSMSSAPCFFSHPPSALCLCLCLSDTHTHTPCALTFRPPPPLPT